MSTSVLSPEFARRPSPQDADMRPDGDDALDYGIFSGLFLRERSGKVTWGYDSPLWRIVPIIAIFAAWLLPLVNILATALSHRQMGLSAPEWANFRMNNGPIAQFILKHIGPLGGHLFGPATAIFSAWALWQLARAFGAPRWSAALVTSFLAIGPIIGLGPNPANYPDYAAFGALIALSLAMTLKAINQKSNDSLAQAFVLSVVACWLAPWVFWPAIAVLLAIVGVTKQFHERPYCASIAALAWGPGIFLAKLYGDTHGFKTGMFERADGGHSAIGQGPHQFETLLLSAADYFQHWPIFSANLAHEFLGLLPFLMMGALAVLGFGLAIASGPPVARNGYASALFLAIAVLGAITTGNHVSARFLLDPLLLSFVAVLGLIVPEALGEIGGNWRGWFANIGAFFRRIWTGFLGLFAPRAKQASAKHAPTKHAPTKHAPTKHAHSNIAQPAAPTRAINMVAGANENHRARPTIAGLWQSFRIWWQANLA